MAQNATVYLDHLIARENLRYERLDVVGAKNTSARPLPETLPLSNLIPELRNRQRDDLRKPDFQRATCAWTPEECCNLLDSIVGERIVPGLIMWKSPDSPLEYILDGAHRISVVLAWLNDDWGDRATNDSEVELHTPTMVMARQMAGVVRGLVNASVGSAKKFMELEATMDRLSRDGQAPKQVMGDLDFSRAMFFAELRKGTVGFRVQWVTGDYRTAEQSFLRINSRSSSKIGIRAWLVRS
jgi:hypothetical protein